MTPGGSGRLRKAASHFHAEAVIAQEDISDARDENPRMRHTRFDLLDIEEEAVAGLAQHAQVLAGIVIHHDRHLYLAFVVLLDALDDPDLPGQRDVHNVAALARTQANTIADR